MKLNVYKIDDNATMPQKATEHSSCFDVNSCLHGDEVSVYYKGGKGVRPIEKDADGNFVIAIHPRERVAVPTGIILDIPQGYDVKVYPRSGLSLKHGITLCNSVGVIDSDYKEELFVTVINNSDDLFIIKDGDRVAQFEMTKKQKVELNQINSKPKQTSERDGGLGSTGTEKLDDDVEPENEGE